MVKMVQCSIQKVSWYCLLQSIVWNPDYSLKKQQPQLIFLVIFPKMNIFTRLNLKSKLSKKINLISDLVVVKDSSKTVLYL